MGSLKQNYASHSKNQNQNLIEIPADKSQNISNSFVLQKYISKHAAPKKEATGAN